MRNKMIIFIKLMQKYSQIFTNIKEKISYFDKTKIESIGFEYKIKNELKKTVKQFNRLLFNPKLAENIFESPIDIINNNNELLEQDNNLLSNDNNVNENEKEEISKEDINNLIEKYESKINILLSENDILKMNKENQTTFQNDLIFKNNDLEKENNELKLTINEYSTKYENILSQYNDLKSKMIRIENDNSILIKENQDLKEEILNLKNEIDPNSDINILKNELSYKNSVIKYLEQLLYNIQQKEGEDSLREEYEKNLNKMKSSKNNLSVSENIFGSQRISEGKEKNKNDKNDKNDKNEKNNKNKNTTNINIKKKMKINEQLLVKNTDSNDDIDNKEVDFEYISDNVNQFDNLMISKEKKGKKDLDIDIKNKNNKSLKPQKIKKEIENLDEEILEIQSQLKKLMEK